MGAAAAAASAARNFVSPGIEDADGLDVGQLDNHWKNYAHRRIHAELPARPKRSKPKVDIHMCLEAASSSSWFVRDDMPTQYYLSAYPPEDPRPEVPRKTPLSPPCTPKFILPPEDVPEMKLYIAEKGLKDFFPQAVPAAWMLDLPERPSTTSSWMSHEEAAAMRTQKRLKESRFTLPGQIDDVLS